jgi:phenylacetate-CoA ligase
MFWNQQVETLSRVDMITWQNYKVEKGIERVFEKSLLYRNRMEECGLQPQDIKTVDDLSKMPFTTRQDIGDNYPFGLLTMPVSGVSYIHKAQDAEGKNTAISYTRNDMTMWTELMSRIVVAGGVNVTSVLQFAVGLEDCADHLSLCYGAAQIGAALVGSGKDTIKEQLCSIQDFGATTLFSTPSHLLLMAQEARAMQVKPEELPLHTIFSGGQPLTETMRRQLQKEYGVNVLEIYGLDSVFGMGIAGECHCGNGLHIGEDCFYPEVVQPMTGQVLQKGEAGELVLTSLVLEAMPLIRYRTGTICHLDENVCACGRTLMRMIIK